jgi:hypothetical protein
MTGGNKHNAAKKITFQRLIKVDLISLMCFSGALVVWIGNIAVMLIGIIVPITMGKHLLVPEFRNLCVTLAAGAGGASIGFLLLLAMRWRFIQDLCTYGKQTVGKVTNSRTILSNLICMQYAYNFNGRDYKNEVVSLRSPRITTVQAGNDIILMVDPANPKHALIQGAYLGTD